ncbi:MAG: type II toxin-antitoxin system RelB/DinJ family antitoxin [Akkermansiaceae bacterium]|jgi:DNA-damage-inducible protein J|nr:type II toxin-antitoxin system RelB/DinJ family antitoxin [Akkermansiaceae bacterium]MDP4645681.1 type II toxin-antitoxin system RelB/DinJ family antitoxin [Akkermansiaceae bacterium]MDP4719928.1 type II toxin-antitoxin system RelB/DinJ family antitoxin [Akkermansiaceae bacterium]MDP4778789.1 type II toxin-antitoxin system RelB/DinJ family antitoxin [Akkermansiaceae bacterium]MDP4847009.1 type II toxin-antitoxin system RelB/DinJ family antitoxin [Akkermansiaceae bacterium]
MAQTAVIHARIDPATKAATERVLEAIGLTPTEAIRLLYRQIAMRGEFPVELRTPNAETARVLSMADSGEDVETFDSTEELYASW